MREFKVDDSNKSVWRLICKRYTQGYRWLLRGIAKPDGLWEITKFHPKHTCDMGQSRADHFNLDINMIAHVLLKHIEETPRMPIKTCISMVHSKNGKIISKRKGFLRRRRAFEMIFETWESSFQGVAPGIWRLYNMLILGNRVVRLAAFRGQKFSTSSFGHSNQVLMVLLSAFNVIWIDGTYVYGRYDIKLLIAVGMDANGSIIPLAFSIAANECSETWGMFLTHLQTHVIKGRQGICVLSDRHKDILHNMRTMKGWQPLHAYHRYCLRNLKANLQTKFGNGTVNKLMWGLRCRSTKKMGQKWSAKEVSEEAYVWLMKLEVEKWTLYAWRKERWGMLTHERLESFNGLLKSTRGLPSPQW
ncbi:uncharacterized protein LOC132039176 [Lycium ferocissimum]|uniref:uncharacterized protein LOC132039176 n=1 Tax=Lycium ferocissimum TaxID=112874 RepID=UPI0028161D4C|nr:uncharacterized protein LOC132039176 [Lycium ferocissimum]